MSKSRKSASRKAAAKNAAPGHTSSSQTAAQRAESQRSSERNRAARSYLKIELWRFALPVLWLGMVGAISFIEAPLKFQAPDITIPLGLGIGRLVFAALNVAEGLVLFALTILSFWPVNHRIESRRLAAWAGLAAVFVIKVVFIRPPLNARTDLVLAGEEGGSSLWHYAYIACDVIGMVLLVIVALLAAKAILNRIAER